MSETDVAEAMLTLSFTRQATRTKTKPKQCLKRSGLLKARARNITSQKPHQDKQGTRAGTVTRVWVTTGNGLLTKSL